MSVTKLLSSFPIHHVNEAVSHIFLSLCRYQTEAGLPTTMVVPSCEPSCRGSDLIEAITPYLKWLRYRMGGVQEVSEQCFLKELNQFDAAYLWPTSTPRLIKRVKATGKPIFLERFNCFTGQAKQILDDAYTRLGLEPQHSIQPSWIEEELEVTELADYILCPSPLVKASFLQAGIPEKKLILTSYGWAPQRFPNLPVHRESQEAVTILFVGYVCVRKGAHLLMQAFAKSGINGRLVLCGRMEPAIAEVCKDLLQRPDIIHQPHQKDLREIYRKADIFAFPSFEEGSPLVSYEAMAHGLPVILSPMGAGDIARDNNELPRRKRTGYQNQKRASCSSLCNWR
jgi:glycosyltransferase involved in cell wall biosynthesis